MNLHAVRSIYARDARTRRTPMQSIISPVISTSPISSCSRGDRLADPGDRRHQPRLFIVPGLIMLLPLTQSIANASFGIYFPKFTGTICELFRHPCPISRSSSAMSAPPRPNRSCSAHHPRDGGTVRAAVHRASGVDARVPAADRGDVQPAGFIITRADGFEKLQPCRC
jgi:hypothetical protein